MSIARRKASGRRVAGAILGVSLIGGAVIEAAAQTPPSIPKKDEPPGQIPEKVAPPLDSSPDSRGGSAGGKFERDDGGIRPRGDVDPDMTAKPPETGARTPVIPPPGSPGGDPAIKPK
jgi:hypothetical protein